MTDLVTETNQKEFQITNDTYLEYLVGYQSNGKRIQEASKENFGKYLTFPWPDKLKEMYTQTGMTGNEVHRQLCLNAHTGGIGFSDISQGTRKSVPDTTYELYFENKTPVINIHTHPEPTMPSTADYLNIVNTFSDGVRLCRSILVLNPDHQILVVATNDTPRIKDETKAVEYLDTLNPNQDPFFEIIGKSARGLTLQAIEKYHEQMQTELRKKSKINFIKNWKINRKVKEVRSQTEKQINSYAETAKEMAAIPFNQALVAIPNELQVVLYFSRDCTNFTKWSA